jgi:hypothetical protein
LFGDVEVVVVVAVEIAMELRCCIKRTSCGVGRGKEE